MEFIWILSFAYTVKHITQLVLDYTLWIQYVRHKITRFRVTWTGNKVSIYFIHFKLKGLYLACIFFFNCYRNELSLSSTLFHNFSHEYSSQVCRILSLYYISIYIYCWYISTVDCSAHKVAYFPNGYSSV